LFLGSPENEETNTNLNLLTLLRPTRDTCVPDLNRHVSEFKVNKAEMSLG